MVTNKTTMPDVTYVLLQNIQLYYTPILVHLGSLGNCLSVCVFFGTKLRYSSSSIYLGALAISDTGFLVSVFVVWLNMVNVDLFNQSGFCQFFVYLTTLCSFLSVWLVVAFTVERFLAVKYPLRRQFLCTVAKAKVAVIGLMTLGVFLCSPVLLFSAPRTLANSKENVTVCHLAKGWESWAIVYNVMDTVLTFAVPFTIIVIFNILIAKNVYKLNRIRRTLTVESNASNEKDICIQNPRCRLPQTKITKMLLIVSSAFLCFNLPAYVMRILAFLHVQEENSVMILAQQMCNMLFNTNFGINFILYCASGQNFRKEIIRMFLCRSRRRSNLMQMTSHRKLHVSEFTSECKSVKRSNSSHATERLPRNENI